jgi:hypothetical protein
LDFVWTAAVGGSHFILDLDFQILLMDHDFTVIADLVDAAK